jgi:hypothetical protein
MKIPILVERALGFFQNATTNRSLDSLSIHRIASIIEEISGEKLYDRAAEDIREDMLRRQREGQGVRRLSASGHVWGLEPGFVAYEGEPDNTPPFVPFDNTANMTAIHAQWRRAYGGALAFGSNVIVPPQERPDQPAPFLSAAVRTSRLEW